ncbi:uncharacterized protein LOC124678881 isoform X1 [Lolium rigidum]|uniref:uncharacterized protein LOC124678881 isoform X1 n=1 Tax=Lolium rigidum TaxID=89674 RepID=UPI001F5C39F7|nr:uncharacterized protein LOC124678881 isoform X1 [Lolium rigidum]
MGRPNRNHLLADLRVGWPELSDTPHANRFPLRIKSDIEWWMCLLLDAHIALGQLVFCFCFYIGSYTNVVQRLGKATSDERLLGLAKRAVLRSGYLIMESFISDEKDDLTTKDFDRFASIIRRVESVHKLGMVTSRSCNSRLFFSTRFSR